MSFFSEDTKQEFINLVYETEVSVVHEKAEYDIWLDGNGYCIAMTSFDGKCITNELQEETLQAFKTPEELVENAVFYDGTKFSDAAEMDHTEIEE